MYGSLFIPINSHVSVASLLPTTPAPCVLVTPQAKTGKLHASGVQTAATTRATLTLDSVTEKIVANLLASKKQPIILKDRLQQQQGLMQQQQQQPLQQQQQQQQPVVPASCYVVL